MIDGGQRGHEGRVLLVALLSPLPAVLVGLGLLWGEEHSSKLRWTLTVFAVTTWLGGAIALRDRVVANWRRISAGNPQLKEEAS